MEWAKNFAETKIAEMGMADMPLLEYTPTQIKIPPNWFNEYKNNTKKFMESLIDNPDDLAFLNLNQNDFMNLIMGRKLPINLSIRLRIPLYVGGTVDIENMFLCKTFPVSHNLDRFIIQQNGHSKIWLPNPSKKIYLTTHTGGGGAGGNATSDRLTQMAAQQSTMSNDMG